MPNQSGSRNVHRNESRNRPPDLPPDVAPASTVLAAAETVFVGLGANLRDPRRQVEEAVEQLAELPLTELIAASRLYRTAPVGPADQPDYINAVVHIETRLAPLPLLAELQRIEREHGRVRDGTRWGPRTLDLDILTFGSRRVRCPGLTLPHPQMHRRAFVLVPLADVAPAALTIPDRGVLAELLQAVSDQDFELLAPMPPAERGSAGAAAGGGDGALRTCGLSRVTDNESQTRREVDL